MKSVNHHQLGKLIKEAFKKKKPLFIWGGIGIGKSTAVRDIAKQLAKDKNLNYNEDMSKINEKGNFSVIDIRMSQMDISDIRGLPKFDENNKTTRWYYPDFLPTNSQGIIFLDELNTACPSVQITAYSLTLDRRVGSYNLPDGWQVISAGNRISDKASIFECPAPLNNRFMHIELEVPSVDDWVEWAIKNKIDTRISTFLKFKPVLYKFDSKVNEKSFPSPRTWAICSEMISDKETRDLDTINILVASCVGEATAIEFTAWLKLSEKIDINEILKNPLEAKLPREIDMTYAMISGILEHYKKDRKLMKPIVQLATRLTPEFAVMMLKLVKTHNTKFVEEVVNLPEWKKDLAKKLQPYFKEETD
jgi:MoxR-like ATPase